MGRDPEYLGFMRKVAHAISAGAPPLTVEEERAGLEASMMAAPKEAVASVEDLTVAGLPGRLYHPERGAAKPGLVYFHGGGFYLGSVEGYDVVARALAAATGCAIVSVGYRLAPEHPFPAGVDDAFAATVEVAGRTGELDLDPARLGVAGDSAGANIAAVTALRMRGVVPLALQLLVYGVFDLSDEPPIPFDPDGLNLDDGGGPAVRDRYLAGADRRDPHASPFLEPDLSGLPPAVVVTAEFDTLRKQGEAYAQRLSAAGVPVQFIPGTGLDHSFLGWGAFARRPAEATAELGAAVRAVLNP